jgi:hypothetical protein
VVAISSAWERYLAWNDAIAETVFTEERAGQPVYLDMDDVVLVDVAARLSVSAENAANELADAVRSTLVLDRGQSDVFRAHLQQLGSWRRSVDQSENLGSMVKAPPTVALLAVFTLAAEAMGSDTAYAVHAYYPRLASILGLSSEKGRERVQLAYQSAAEKLWRGLNDWLTLADGLSRRHSFAPRIVGISHRCSASSGCRQAATCHRLT